MANVAGNHPSVDEAMGTATHGRGPAHSVDHGMRTAHHGRASANVQMPKRGRMDAEDRRDGGRDESTEKS